jgi:hypothetical protein
MEIRKEKEKRKW